MQPKGILDYAPLGIHDTMHYLFGLGTQPKIILLYGVALAGQLSKQFESETQNVT